MKIAPQHWKLLEILAKKKFQIVLLIGERSTGKTTDASQCMLIKVLANIQKFQKTKTVKKVSIMRQNYGSIKTSIWQSIVNNYPNLENTNEFRNHAVLQETTIGSKKAGQTWMFAKGFKSSTKTDTAAQKGLEAVNAYLIDEAEEISKQDLDQLTDTAIREAAVIILICNTPHKKHWITETYLDLLPTKYEGYSDFVAKPLSNFTLIRSRMGDNPFLTDEARAIYQDRGNPKSISYNLDRYCRDVLGLVSSNVKGQIFKNYTVCTNREFDELDAPSKFGLDFGFSDDPTVLVETKQVKGWLFVKEWIYETGLTNTLLIKKFEQLGITKQTRIIADNGALGVMLISELQAIGWNIHPATKGPGSVEAGIMKLKEYLQIFITQSSQNVLNEFNNYSYELDANKEPTTKPIDGYNHAIDGLRYLELKKYKPVVKLNQNYQELLNVTKNV